MSNLLYVAHYINSSSKEGETGLTPTIDVDRFHRANMERDAPVTGAGTEEARNGLYYYWVQNADLATYDYAVTFKTTSEDVVQKHLAGIWVRWTEAHATELAYLDQALSTTESNIRGADSDTLKTLSDAIDDIPTQGSGATEETLTIQDGDSNPLDGAEVWLTTDVGGSNVVASGVTDALGQVTVWLDAGTYYAWVQLAGYDISNPTTVTVS